MDDPSVVRNPTKREMAPNQGLLASTKYAKTVNSVVDEFRACGLPLKLNTPTIVIIGAQSSGKTSIIEALTGVPLPRGSGGCTRCPIEIRSMRSDDEWKCKVSIRTESDDAGNKADQVQEVPFGNVITSLDDVADRVQRAQLAALSPYQDPNEFLKGGQKDTKGTVAFSNTTICLSISGKECISMSLINLPGLLPFDPAAGPKGGDNDLIGRLFLSKTICESTQILVAIDASDRAPDQTGLKLAREMDPSGHRTLAILTKTDLIQPGEEEKWIKMLIGHEDLFGTKIYAVRNLEAKELQADMSLEEGRNIEKVFFANEPWSTLSMPIRARLGMMNLAHELGHYLEQFAMLALPSHLLGIELEKVTSRLKTLPPRVTMEDSVLHLTNLCLEFCKKLDAAVKDGNEEDEDGRLPVVRDIKGCALDRLQARVRAAEPLVLPNKEFEELTATQLRPYAVKSKKDMFTTERDLKQGQTICYRLSDFRVMLQQQNSFELGGTVPHATKVRLMKESLQYIPALQAYYFEVVKRIFTERVAELIDAVFGHHKFGGLHEKVSTTMRGIQTRCEGRLTDFLRALWENENHIPYTYDDRFDTESYIYRCKIEKPMFPSPKSVELVSQNLAPAHDDGFDMYGEELRIWSEVAAYWKIASKQIVDVIIKAILRQYIAGVARETGETLATELDLYSADSATRCAAYLVEHEDTTEEREKLTSRKERLAKGLDVIRTLEDHCDEC